MSEGTLVELTPTPDNSDPLSRLTSKSFTEETLKGLSKDLKVVGAITIAYAKNEDDEDHEGYYYAYEGLSSVEAVGVLDVVKSMIKLRDIGLSNYSSEE